MKCRVGDLAVVIDAYHRSNLGRIVHVIAPHDGTGDLPFRDAGPVWLVQADQPLTWSVAAKQVRRKIGPAPDRQLQPIRGGWPDPPSIDSGRRQPDGRGRFVATPGLAASPTRLAAIASTTRE